MGISTVSGLNGKFGQVGTAGVITCRAGGCSSGQQITYNLWYEFDSSFGGEQNCGSASAGDVIYDDTFYSLSLSMCT